MKTTITKIFNFEAAHSLPNHDGQCKNLHGHSYRLEVSLSGEIQTSGAKDGMILDFADVSKIVKDKVISKYDHTYLNDILSFTPTLENISSHIFQVLQQEGLPVSKIRLWETEKSFVETTL